MMRDGGERREKRGKGARGGDEGKKEEKRGEAMT